MIDLGKLKSALDSTGIPVAYHAFPEGNAPDLPFICYYCDETNNMYADNSVYYRIDGVTVELYTKNKDINAEGKVEQALSSFCWSKNEDYIDSEKCYQIMYEMED